MLNHQHSLLKKKKTPQPALPKSRVNNRAKAQTAPPWHRPVLSPSQKHQKALIVQKFHQNIQRVHDPPFCAGAMHSIPMTGAIVPAIMSIPIRLSSRKIVLHP